jgi:hypothetical protein
MYYRCIRVVKYIYAGIDLTLTMLKLIITIPPLFTSPRKHSIHADLHNYQYSLPLEYERQIIYLSPYRIFNSVD